MKVAYLTEPRKIEIFDIPKPKPKPKEVLVRIKAALTCGTDLKAYMRGHPLIPMPGPFGHEFSGVIEEVGEEVEGFRAGDAVMLVHTAPCGMCVYCKRELFNHCISLKRDMMLGAFAELILVKERVVTTNMFTKPEHVSFDEAAFLEPLSCVVHGVRVLSPSRGDRVLLIGTGPVALLFLQVLKVKEVSVAVLGRNREKLQLASSLGADSVFELNQNPLDLVDGFGYDSVIECTGQKEVWTKAVDFVRKGGKVLLFGGLKVGTEVCYDATRIHYDEIELRGVFHYCPDDVKQAYELICSGKLRLKELISGRYSLTDIVQAFEKLSKGEGIKYLIVP